MKLHDINIRDPFVLPYMGKYYMYGTRAATCWGECDGFDVYVSDSLDDWSNPIEAFHKPEGFWADLNYWAPEVHIYKDSFYAFVSFKSSDRCRGTQILRSDAPTGPFVPHSEGPVTPAGWECLDGTFFVNNEGQPYMVFCHEWVQVRDGEMCLIRLSEDLKRAESEPVVLFTASEPGWTRGVKNGPNFVTDGPFLYKPDKDSLVMLWSSFGDGGYAQAIARSATGSITGPWIHDKEPIFSRDGGHGMIFRAFDGQLYLTLHSPNEKLKEHPVFIELNDDLTIKC
jgi:arabinan endo-1,5-alpha-L-arabinosidase